ncbi:MAG: Ldh family oxidoreductase [Betaproteobacteria bacterium]|nr:Ldh family oxidoreductase [Betaproteobacteria bacterium]
MIPATHTSTLLDPDEPDTIRLTEAEARAIGETAVQRIGYTAEDARIVVDQLIDNMLCGYKFAGLPRILAMAGDEKINDARTPIKVVKETTVSALMDGGNNIGYVTCYHAAQMAIEKAQAHGVSCVGVYNTYYSGRNAYFVEHIVNAGLVCMHSGANKPRVVPPGAARPALGTNPISFGFPSEEGAVIVDMGTAALMWGDVLLHAHLGEPLPEGVGVDQHGNPTRDAAAAVKGGVAPFGGKDYVYKGYGLSFAMQALGLLAGSAIVRDTPMDYGFLFWAVNPEIMLPGNDFKQRMSQFVRDMKALPKRPGVNEIRIPSERANRERERRRVEGIVVKRKVIESLRAL